MITKTIKSGKNEFTFNYENNLLTIAKTGVKENVIESIVNATVNDNNIINIGFEKMLNKVEFTQKMSCLYNQNFKQLELLESRLDMIETICKELNIKLNN
jgi:hypothetical protein